MNEHETHFPDSPSRTAALNWSSTKCALLQNCSSKRLLKARSGLFLVLAAAECGLCRNSHRGNDTTTPCLCLSLENLQGRFSESFFHFHQVEDVRSPEQLGSAAHEQCRPQSASGRQFSPPPRELPGSQRKTGVPSVPHSSLPGGWTPAAVTTSTPNSVPSARRHTGVLRPLALNCGLDSLWKYGTSFVEEIL